jgi:acyl carrier protein
MNELEQELKQLIITTLDLEDISANDIDSHEALFIEGLGLDSIDALELGIALQKNYNITLKSDSTETKTHFSSVHHLALMIAEQKNT